MPKSSVGKTATRKPRANDLEILLDTHVLIWAAAEPHRLSSEALDIIRSTSSQRYFSPVSLWEMAIKQSFGRDNLPIDPIRLRRGLTQNGYTELPITSDHALTTTQLPPLHKDPFDRLLLAQALHEGILLLTHDKQMAAYEGPVRLV